MLRTRESRREEPLGVRMPDPIRQLASRARRRVQGAGAAPDPDLARQREVVDAFFAAARDGNLEALVAVLDPEVVLRADGGTARARRTFVIHGAGAVAAQAVTGARFSPFVRPALINGTAGVAAGGRALSVMGFTVAHGKIVAIDVLYDPERLADLDWRSSTMPVSTAAEALRSRVRPSRHWRGRSPTAGSRSYPRRGCRSSHPDAISPPGNRG
jgi:hypothetical protein